MNTVMNNAIVPILICLGKASRLFKQLTGVSTPKLTKRYER